MNSMNSLDNESVVKQKKYRLGIIMGGNILDETGFLRVISGCDIIVCADSGARHLRPYGILPDLLVGDLDSIAEADRSWLEYAQVPVNKFPQEKDFTDAELAVENALDLFTEFLNEQELPRPVNGDISICLLAVTGDRPDHVLGNQMMAAGLARQQYDVMMTDGRSWFYFLDGPTEKTYDISLLEYDSAVSAVALSDQVSGLTYSGLKYPLDKFNLAYGSQRGISNCLADYSEPEFSVTITGGTLLLIITPAV
jgi:thiamine pyrophosphokinase